MNLTLAQRGLLWTIAQHKYGWAHCPNVGGRVRHLQTARALARRGLVSVDCSGSYPTVAATDLGRAEIAWRWPQSPFNLGTYTRPEPYGWDPRPRADLCDNGMDPFWPRVQCTECFRFVGHDGSISVEYFEMSSTVASVDGVCRACLEGKR